MSIIATAEGQGNTNWFIEFVSYAEAVWGSLVVLIVLILSVAFLIRLTRSLNKDSLEQIAIFGREGKYIKELYVELDETQETLRYFVFSARWKQRIIRTFNCVFNSLEGKTIKKIVRSKSFKISRYTKKSHVHIKLEEYKEYFETIRTQKELSEKLGDYYYKLQNRAYSYAREIDKLIYLNEISLSKFCLLIGNAGNGKTNALCRVSQLLIRNGFPCIFINAKDIQKKNCFDYFIERLNMPDMIKKYYKTYLFATNVLLLLRRKHLVLVIDAINENDHDEFAESLGELVTRLGKYKRLKILMSCRSEYFDARYKRFFERSASPILISTGELDYSTRAKAQILSAYSKHFMFNGRIFSNAKRDLFRSLLLMRIFFEVYENKNDRVASLNNHEIYQRYIEKLAEQNQAIDLKGILNNMVSKMLVDADYSGAELSALGVSSETFDQLKNMLDNNLLISKTYVKNEGLITAEKQEKLYFVFDELRDFWISKCLLSQDDDGNFFQICDNLYTNRKSPLEGILKHAYIHFKKTGKLDNCKKILDTYCDENIHAWKYVEQHRWYEGAENIFASFGITIIFSNMEMVLDFEKIYILNASKNDDRDFWQMFFYLLANEYVEESLGVSVLVDAVCMLDDVADFTKLFARLNSDQYGEERLAFKIHLKLKSLEESGSEISVGIKWFILLIKIVDPSEDVFDDLLEKVIAEERAFGELVEKIKMPEVKSGLLQLKDGKRPVIGDEGHMPLFFKISFGNE